MSIDVPLDTVSREAGQVQDKAKPEILIDKKPKKEGKPETVGAVVKKMYNANVSRIRKKEAQEISRINNMSIGDLLKFFYSSQTKHRLYGLVSFVMTTLYYMTFTSPDFANVMVEGFQNYINPTDSPEGLQLGDAVGAGIWAAVGFLFSITITLLIMHSHTSGRKGGGIGGWLVYVIIILLGITFNVFTETASTADRVDERVKVKSESSSVYKAIVGKIATSSGTSSRALVSAREKLADAMGEKTTYCPKRTDGKKNRDYSAKKCKFANMHISEYKALVKMSEEGASTEQSQTIKDANEAGRNTDNAQMSIKLLMQFLKTPTISDKNLFIYATILISLFIITVFEILGAMIGRDYVYYRNLLQERGVNLNKSLELKVLKRRLADEDKEAKAFNTFNIKRAKQVASLYKETAKANKQTEGIYKEGDTINGSLDPVTPQVNTGAPASLAPQVPRNIPGMHSLMSSGADLNPPSSFVDLGETYEELLARRKEHSNKQSGKGTCPNCLKVFDKPSYQHVYCDPSHAVEFARVLKRLKRVGV